MEKFDLVVIGGHLAAVVAIEAARLGARVALVRNPGVHNPLAARARAKRRSIIVAGLKGPAHALDVLRQCDSPQTLPHDPTMLEMAPAGGIVVREGHAVFTGRDSLAVHGQELRFRRAVIAAEASPTVPAIPGLAAAGYLTGDNWPALGWMPRRIAILGAGGEACELAQAFARCGATVHLVCGESILPGYDADAVEIVAAQLRGEGVHLHAGWSCASIEARGANKRLLLRGFDATINVFVDEVVVACGRTLNCDRMALAIAGIRTRDTCIVVDNRLATTNAHVFAAVDESAGGDIHLARLMVRNALLAAGLKHQPGAIPKVVMTDPQIASLGTLSSGNGDATPDRDRLRVSDRDLVAATEHAGTGKSICRGADPHPDLPLEATGAAVADLDPTTRLATERCLVVIETHVRSGRIVGAQIVGSQAAEVVNLFSLLVQRKLPLRVLAELPLAPTLTSRLLRHVAHCREQHAPHSAPARAA
jgi:pyruvate/2-oxoglutarate dehydrogenase complex dihydrolipoamide dehydrogenase (E3) component